MGTRTVGEAFEIVDAQVHIWEAESRDRPWPADRRHYAHRSEFTAEQLIDEMNLAGVDRAILIPASFAGDRNDYCLDAAHRFSERFAVVGRLPIGQVGYRENRDLIANSWQDEDALLGFRVSFAREFARRWIEDGTVDWLWPLADKLEIPIVVNAGGNLSYVDRLAARYPDLKLTIDHFGAPSSARDEELDDVLDELLLLARKPNVAVKATCLPLLVTDTYPYPSLHNRIGRVIAAFGPERVFWGSDVTRLPCTYREVVTLFTEELQLNREELELVMGKGLRLWMSWTDRGPDR